jgi:hypothetical protein
MGLMTKYFLQVACAACLFAILVTTGCVAPPKDTGTPVPAMTSIPAQVPVTTTQSQSLVTEATPFQFKITPTFAYYTLPASTPIPGDMVCLIDFNSYDWTFTSNITAKRFNLVNPPMYINYTITDPYNVTGTHLVTAKDGTDQNVAYSYYSPSAYLEITVRDPVTGTIYTQDGFGKNYGEILNKSIEITQPGNILIEIQGNNVTPTVGLWAKQAGNFDNTAVNITTHECHSQDFFMNLNQ